jgi:hypothetical protein
MLRFCDLKLERNHVTCWLLSWALMHGIDETSPLWGLTQDDLIAQEVQIILAVAGTDDTLAQSVHTYHCYEAEEIILGHRFFRHLCADSGGAVQCRFWPLEPDPPTLGSGVSRAARTGANAARDVASGTKRRLL